MSNVLSLLESILGSVELEGRNWRFRCPFPSCLHSHRSNLAILIETSDSGENPWHCWSCGKSGKKIRSLFKKAFKDNDLYLQKIDALIIPKYYIHNPKPTEEKLCVLPEEFCGFINNKGSFDQIDTIRRRISAYLSIRGIEVRDIAKYNIGFCKTGKYENRFIIPSYDANGQLNYWVARTIIEGTVPRYLTPDVPFKDIVPFELYINWKVPVILCEGFLDAIAIKRNAIPLNGKEIHGGLMKKLLSSDVKSVYICLDKDALKNAMNHAEKLIAAGKEVHLIELPEKDPSEIGFKAMSNIIRESKPITGESLFLRKLRMKLFE